MVDLKDIGLHRGAFEVPASKIIKILQAATAGLGCDPSVSFYQSGIDLCIKCSSKNGAGYIYTMTAYLDVVKGNLNFKCSCVKMETLDFLA